METDNWRFSGQFSSIYNLDPQRNQMTSSHIKPWCGSRLQEPILMHVHSPQKSTNELNKLLLELPVLCWLWCEKTINSVTQFEIPKTKGSLSMKIFIDRQRQHWLQGDGGEPTKWTWKPLRIFGSITRGHTIVHNYSSIPLEWAFYFHGRHSVFKVSFMEKLDGMPYSLRS
jgi:hypothetical protein